MFSECSYNVLISGQVWANTRHRPNVGPMLGQHRRRWLNIGLALGRWLVFAGKDSSIVHLNYIYNRPFFRNCGHDQNSK